MNKKCFQFDMNKCVGCHACVVACSIENKTLPQIQWREITSVNPSGFPDLPLFHFSLACNHCLDAPCMQNCPALAYTRDTITGAVIHHAEKCIGCKYCTWACPYDAPKFNPKTRIIEKCTFCNHRIADSLKPACANLCPVGALDFIDMPDNLENENIPGFSDSGIRPAIQIIPPVKDKPILVCSEQQIMTKPDKIKVPDSKIKLKHEWPLAVFTLLAAVLVSLLTAVAMEKTVINPWLFILPGAVGMTLSLVHLGRKERALRSILNLKNSWLSREIFFFMLFFGLGSLYLLFVKENFIAWPAIIFGILALFSIDKVYELAIQPIKLELHSAHVFLSYFLFTAIFMGQYFALAIIILIKAATYGYRKLEMRKLKKNYRMFISAWRLDLLISFPVIFWIFGISNIQWWVFASILLGEMIDRAEYYDELDIITPKKQVEMDFQK